MTSREALTAQRRLHMVLYTLALAAAAFAILLPMAPTILPMLSRYMRAGDDSDLTYSWHSLTPGVDYGIRIKGAGAEAKDWCKKVRNTSPGRVREQLEWIVEKTDGSKTMVRATYDLDPGKSKKCEIEGFFDPSKISAVSAKHIKKENL